MHMRFREGSGGARCLLETVARARLGKIRSTVLLTYNPLIITIIKVLCLRERCGGVFSLGTLERGPCRLHFFSGFWKTAKNGMKAYSCAQPLLMRHARSTQREKTEEIKW